MSDISIELRKLEDKFLLISKKREENLKKLDELQKEKEKLIEDISTRVEAIDYIERVANEERLDVKEKVETLITSCLQEVFDDSYSIEFDYGVKGSRTSVDIYLKRKCKDGLVVKRKIDGFGGGVADTISLPLKLIVLMNDKDYTKILFADEPGKHLDIEKVPKLGRFLKNISDKLGIQIIMSSHHDGMDDFADSVNYIKLIGSQSYVYKIK